MLNSFEIPIPNDKLTTAKIIAAALPSGALIFLGVVLAMTLGNGKPLSWNTEIMTLVLIFQSVVIIPAFLVAPKIVAKTTLQQSFQSRDLRQELEEEIANPENGFRTINNLLGVYQTCMIIGTALIEGMTFFAIVVVLQDQSGIALAIAIAGILLMYLRIPTESSIQNWIAYQAEQFVSEESGKRKIG